MGDIEAPQLIHSAHAPPHSAPARVVNDTLTTPGLQSAPKSVSQPLPVPIPPACMSKNGGTSNEFSAEEFWKSASNPDYKDFDGQNRRHKGDSSSNIHTEERRSILWLRTLGRGRFVFAFVPVLISVIWSFVAVYLSILFKGRVSQTGCKWFCSQLGLDPNTHSYVGFALFLLLGLRVNESHKRYLEGLQTWKNIEGNIVTLATCVLQAFPCSLFHQGDHERILGWLVAFPVALKRELRDQRDLNELKNILSPEDISALQRVPNMPAHCVYVLSTYIIKTLSMEGNKFPGVFLVCLLRWIKELGDYADRCSRIRRTPCAFSYIAHLRTFLFLWLFFLPFTLAEATSWGTPLIVAFITYGVVGVEMNAAELENPFGMDLNDIPLAKLCDQIIDGVRQTYDAAQSDERTHVNSFA